MTSNKKVIAYYNALEIAREYNGEEEVKKLRKLYRTSTTASLEEKIDEYLALIGEQGDLPIQQEIVRDDDKKEEKEEKEGKEGEDKDEDKDEDSDDDTDDDFKDFEDMTSEEKEKDEKKTQRLLEISRKITHAA